MIKMITYRAGYAFIVHDWFITRFTLYVTLKVFLLEGFVFEFRAVLAYKSFPTFKFDMFNALFVYYFIFTIETGNRAVGMLSHDHLGCGLMKK